MKILIINDSFGKGGKERRMTELIKYLKTNSEFEIDLIILDDRIEYKEVYQYADNVYLIPGRKPLQLLSMIYKVLSICHRFKPDVVHCWGDLSLLFCGVSKLFYRFKLLNSVIADAPSKYAINKTPEVKKLYNRLTFSYYYSDYITSNCKAGLVSYNAPEKISQYIYNGFNYHRLNNLTDSSLIRKNLQLADNAIIIGMVAAFEQRKDYDTVIDVANELLAEVENCYFMLIGDGQLKSKIEDKVNPEFKSRVLFLGKINNVEDYINIFDIGILSSNSNAHGEGISNAILEYMALKKPVIASAGGGTNEIVIDNWNGYLVQPQNPHQLVEKLLFLIQNKDKRVIFGRNAYDLINQEFGIEKMCNKFQSLYISLIDK